MEKWIFAQNLENGKNENLENLENQKKMFRPLFCLSNLLVDVNFPKFSPAAGSYRVDLEFEIEGTVAWPGMCPGGG